MNTALTYVLILVASSVLDGQTVTNMVTIDNYKTKQECASQLRYLQQSLTTADFVIEFAECAADETTGA